MENNITKISAAFVKAQSQFAPALKTSTNSHFKNKYAALDACVEAVMSALNANGIALMQQVFPVDEKQMPGIIVETILIHESGERLHCGKLHFPVMKQDAQNYMSCLTYARRGSLMAACGIAPEDDDGNEASKQKPPGRLSDVKYKHYCREIEKANSIEELTAVFGLAYRQAKDIDDQDSLNVFVDKKDERKLQLTKDQNG